MYRYIEECHGTQASQNNTQASQNTRDVCIGLFLAGLIVDYTQLSKRLVPELMPFFTTLLAKGFALTAQGVVDSKDTTTTAPTTTTNTSSSSTSSSSSSELATFLDRLPAVNVLLSGLWSTSVATDSAPSPLPLACAFLSSKHAVFKQEWLKRYFLSLILFFQTLY